MAFRSRFCSPLMMIVFVFLFLVMLTSANPIENVKNALVTNVKETNDGKFVSFDADVDEGLQKFTITLEQKSEIASSAASAQISKERIEKIQKCSYDGRATAADGNKEYKAYGTMCQGRLRVIVEIDNDPLIIRGDVYGKPLSPDTSVRGKRSNEREDGPAVAETWRLSDELSALKANATDNALIPPDAKVLSESSDVKKGKRKPQSTGEKVVELLFWGSTDRMNAFGYDVDAYMEESVLQLKAIQAVYDNTGFSPRIRFVIKQFLYTPQGDTDPWGYVSSTEMLTMLNSVTSWVQGSPSALDISADSLIVTTKRDESFSGAVGYAWIGGVCNKARYANVNAVTKDVVLYGSIIIAHEFGHTFGFMHDGSSSAGTGSCDADPNIMGPTLNGDESVFSQCSIDQYNAGSYRSGGTLYSVDHTCLTEPTDFLCGNGIREEGEDCDCYGNDCTGIDASCDASTCKFLPGKSCSQLHDLCCNSDQTGVAASGTVCRAASGSCDLPETCDGASVTCPTDLYKPLGTKCEESNGDVGSCYEGTCENRDVQCRQVGSYYGGFFASDSCAGQYSYLSSYGASDFHTFEESDCTEDLWCTTADSNTCVGVSTLRYWSSVKKRHNGFPCSTVGSSDTFSKICYEGACTSVDVIKGTVSPPPPSLPPSPMPPPGAINPSPPPPPPPNPPPSNPPPPMPPTQTTSSPPPVLLEERKTYPPPANLDGDDVTTNGVVNYLTVYITISGYAPADFNVIANRNAFMDGLSNYLGLSAGRDGVTFVRASNNATRRRLLSTSSESMVQVTLLLTASDSVAEISAALDTDVASKAQSMQRTMSESLPKMDTVSVTSVSASTENVDVNYTPQDDVEEDIEVFGSDLIIGGIAGVVVLPLVIFFFGLIGGPKTRMGRLTAVIIGESLYQRLRIACCCAPVPGLDGK